MHRFVLRAAVVSTAAALVLAVGAASASAHVRVYAYTPAVQGGYDALVFRVPAEESTPTVKVAVSMPVDHPIASVSVRQKPGWTVTVARRTLTTPMRTDDGAVTSVVATVTWAATAGGIPPGSYDEFDVSVGPLPRVSSLAFPTVQTYGDGDVVRWIEPTPPGGDEPDHPVPVLDLVPASSSAPSGSSGSSGSPGSSGSSAAGSARPAPATGAATGAATAPTSPSIAVAAPASDDGTARALGIAGVVAGVTGLLAGAGGLLAARRRP